MKKETKPPIWPSPELVLVVFLIGLQLDGVIDWPWVLVLVGVLGLLISALDRPER